MSNELMSSSSHPEGHSTRQHVEQNDLQKLMSHTHRLTSHFAYWAVNLYTAWSISKDDMKVKQFWKALHHVKACSLECERLTPRAQQSVADAFESANSFLAAPKTSGG